MNGDALMTPSWVISKVFGTLQRVWTRNFDLGYFLEGLGKNFLDCWHIEEEWKEIVVVSIVTVRSFLSLVWHTWPDKKD